MFYIISYLYFISVYFKHGYYFCLQENQSESHEKDADQNLEELLSLKLKYEDLKAKHKKFAQLISQKVPSIEKEEKLDSQ